MKNSNERNISWGVNWWRLIWIYANCVVPRRPYGSSTSVNVKVLNFSAISQWNKWEKFWLPGDDDIILARARECWSFGNLCAPLQGREKLRRHLVEPVLSCRKRVKKFAKHVTAAAKKCKCQFVVENDATRVGKSCPGGKLISSSSGTKSIKGRSSWSSRKVCEKVKSEGKVDIFFSVYMGNQS